MGKTKAVNIGLLLVITLFLLAVFAISIAIVVKVYKKDNNNSICVTEQSSSANIYSDVPIPKNDPKAPSYKQASDLFLSMINVTADPCNNFYDYVCGAFNYADGISFYRLDTQNYKTMATKMSDQTYRSSLQQVKPMAQLFSFFDKCQAAYSDGSTVNTDDVKQKLKDFQTATGLSFPLIDQTNAPNFDKTTLAKAVGYLDGAFQISTFLTFYVDTNWISPRGGYLLQVDQSTLAYGDGYYLKAWALINEAYRNRTIDLIYQLNSGLNLNQVTTAVDDMFNLELKIATTVSTDESTRRHFARMYNVYTTKQASTEFDFFDWPAYFAQVTMNAADEVKLLTSRSDFTFSINEPDALKRLASLLSQTPSNTIANYLNFRVLYEFKSRMQPPTERNVLLDETKYVKPRIGRPRLIRHRTVVKEEESTSVVCAAETMESMQYANARAYVDATYSTADEITKMRKNVAQYVDEILIGFRSMLDQLSWMSSASRKGAVSKVDNLVKNIAFPDFILDNTQLANYYADLEFLDSDTFLQQLDKLRIVRTKISLNSLLQSDSEREYFDLPPGTVNAWYQPELNSITFPAAILNQPFFDPNWPASINFGALGVVAGHELTHAFDDQGVQWDGTGVLYQWMDNSTYSSFQDMANCVINEYGGFCPLPDSYKPSNCLDGTQTQGENIADNGGIRAAYRAYRNYVNFNGPDPLFDDPVMGLFNHDQLFFMSFAQVWCENTPEESRTLNQILVNPHSPSIYRVFGTIQNFPAFRDAFHCPLNSNYAPNKHCNVWVSDIPGSFGVPAAPDGDSAVNVKSPAQVSPSDKDKYSAYADYVKLLHDSVNLDVDPCMDFQQYACGNYHKQVSFHYGDELNYLTMATQMEDPKYNSPTTSEAMNKTIRFYNECKTTRSNYAQYIQNGTRIKNIMDEFSAATNWKFPMVSDSALPQQAYDVQALSKALALLSRQGVHTFVTPFVDTNWKTPQNYAFFLDQNSLYYSKTYYAADAWNATVKPVYKQYVMQLIMDYSNVSSPTTSLDPALLNQNVEELLEFEHELATNYSTDDTTRRKYERSYNSYTMANASAAFTFLDFASYFSTLSGNNANLNTYLTTSTFFVMETEKLGMLNGYQLLNSNKVINYLFFRLLASNDDYLPTSSGARILPFAEKTTKLGRRRGPLERIVTATYPDDPRKQCAFETLTYMQYANARFFVDYLYPDDASKTTIKNSVGYIIDNVLLSFRGMLNRLDWMSTDSKKGAYDKINQLARNIAYPDIVVNDTLLDNYYGALVFDAGDDYLAMRKKLDQFNFGLSYNILLDNTQVDRNDFSGPPGTINAWYLPELNSITFPAGILRQPFFDLNWPASLNYGALGVVAGHELTHGFDDEGVQWDGVGALNGWMDTESQKSFNAMAACVVQEYSGFCPLNGTDYQPQCIKGDQTQGENIADNGGIHAAWNSYKEYIALHGADPQLPDPALGLFTHDQLFFLGFAQVWCEEPRTLANQYKQLMVDPHSPGKYRVLGTVKNFPAFRTAFNCPVSTESYCSVWVPNVQNGA